MPYWLNLDWIIPNAIPLAVALLLGFILGWLLTGLSPARRAREYEARATELESKYRKADRDLSDLRRESEPLRTRVTGLQGELEAAKARVPALEKSLAALEEEKSALLAAQAEREAQAAEAEMAALEAAGAEDSAGTPEAEEELELGIAPADRLDSDQIAAGFAALARNPAPVTTPSATEVALNEAYARVAQLQQQLEERERTLHGRVAELESAKAEATAANAARHEMENRLIRAREDVAGELAVLASTMIKMKDDAISRADARIATLNAELEAVRSAPARPASPALTSAE